MQNPLELGQMDCIDCIVLASDADEAGGLVPKFRDRKQIARNFLGSGSDRIQQSPSAVGETLRVIRVSRRTPSRVSRARIEWLRPDWDIPSSAAALVKLRSRATTGAGTGSRNPVLGMRKLPDTTGGADARRAIRPRHQQPLSLR